MPSDRGVILSLNVSPGGVPKLAVSKARVSAAGLDGDGQRDLRHHGGPDRALCLFSMDRIEELQREGHPIAPGTAGENLTISGLDWNLIVPGTVLRVGEVTIEITAYSAPCATIRPSFADGNSNRISQQKHPGWSRMYARVVGTGEFRAGDSVIVVDA